jgi:Ca2+-binding EF-hand superfamily protein
MSDKGYDEDAGDAETLTKEEEAKCWEAFSAFDKDSSGWIDLSDIKGVYNAARHPDVLAGKKTED